MLRDDLNNTYNNLNKKSVGCGKSSIYRILQG